LDSVGVRKESHLEGAVEIADWDALPNVWKTHHLSLSPVDIILNPSREELRQRGSIFQEYHEPTRDPWLGVINIAS
jgi:hypothetical protein